MLEIMVHQPMWAGGSRQPRVQYQLSAMYEFKQVRTKYQLSAMYEFK
jgi:hypothetical protein